jgi:hypothetical protein
MRHVNEHDLVGQRRAAIACDPRPERRESSQRGIDHDASALWVVSPAA